MVTDGALEVAVWATFFVIVSVAVGVVVGIVVGLIASRMDRW